MVEKFNPAAPDKYAAKPKSATSADQGAHDKLDALQLELHARVYQSLLNGMSEYWENQTWTGTGRGAGR